MSSFDHAVRPSAPSAHALASWLAARPGLLLGVAIVAAACLGQLTALAKLQAVWTTGAFFDTDDAMRAVQVRDLMAGQNWFDMTQYRLDPPAGVFMHWSRVVDAPLVLLIKGFGVVTDPTTAERFARLAFPFLLTLAFFALAVRLCEILLGRDARWPALAAAFLYGPATGQFEPGRIDHHAPQIVLLVLAVTALCHAVVNVRPRWATAAGAAIALSMAISVENVPFFVPLFGALVLLWIVDAARMSAVLAAFAAGLALALPAVYVATIAPSRYLVIAADALSLAQAAAMLACAAFAATLSILESRLSGSISARASVALIGGTATSLALVLLFPQLAESPFAALDPLVKSFWLDGVKEALPLPKKFADDPFSAIAIIVPALIGLYGAFRAIRQTPGRRRHAWIMLALPAIGGLAASLSMNRTMAAVLALCIPGALALALAFHAALAARLPALRGPFTACLLLVVTSSVGWAAICGRAKGFAAPPSTSLFAVNDHPAREAAAGASPRNLQTCTAPAAFAALAARPPGRLLADPDLGAYILAHTRHAVVAGAYHRNGAGMRATITAMLASPADAAAAVAATGADVIAFCRGAVDPQYVVSAPDGLATHLAQADAPTWLQGHGTHREIIHIYDVSKARTIEK